MPNNKLDPQTGSGLDFAPGFLDEGLQAVLTSELARLLEQGSPVLLAVLWRGLLGDRPEPITAGLHAQQLAEHVIATAAAPRCESADTTAQADASTDPKE